MAHPTSQTNPRRRARVIDRIRGQMRARSARRSLDAHERPQDVHSTRAKSSGHGKKTADKWNQ